MSNLRVRDLMTSNAVAVGLDEPVTTIRELMSERNIRHVPVLDDDKAVVGLVSERDLLRRTFGPDADLPLSLQRDVMTAVKARDVMTWEVDTVAPDEDLASAAQAMLDNKYGCLPVVDEDMSLIGILTEADFVRLATERRRITVEK
jgi:CBS domain-containing membrane protein